MKGQDLMIGRVMLIVGYAIHSLPVQGVEKCEA
jgi:hypothetical protein